MDPKYHPKIIGRKGAVITQIRLEHDVSIQFPDKDDGSQVSTPLRSATARRGGQAGPASTCVLTGSREQAHARPDGRPEARAGAQVSDFAFGRGSVPAG